MNDELREALDQIDMESYLDREGVDYKVTRGARGTQLNLKECPVCGDSKWRVYLNAETGLGNCFHGDCETKFNKWKFISSLLDGVATREVIDHVKEVAKEQGWRPKPVRAATTTTDELVIPESIALPHNGRNLKYLSDRGISPEMAEYFKLRYSVDGSFWYTGPDGRRIKQDYSNRVIIPVYDLDGSLVSFQGRDITGTAAKKYLFPPGFASTGAILYNGQNAVGASRVVIGEGAFDVIAIKMALDEDESLRDVAAIGSFGKNLSTGDDSQILRLVRLKEHGLKEVTLMWDGEKRATADAVKAAMEIRKLGIAARIAFLPRDKDPNEVPASVVRKAYKDAMILNQINAAKIKLMCLG